MYHEAAKISGERFCVFYPFKNRFFFLNPWVQLEFFRNCGSISKIVGPAFEMMMNSRVAWLKQIVISRWVIWREQCSDGHHSASNQGSRRNSSPFHCTSSHKLCHQLNWLQMLQNRQNRHCDNFWTVHCDLQGIRSFPKIYLAALQCNECGLKLPLSTLGGDFTTQNLRKHISGNRCAVLKIVHP